MNSYRYRTALASTALAGALLAAACGDEGGTAKAASPTQAPAPVASPTTVSTTTVTTTRPTPTTVNVATVAAKFTMSAGDLPRGFAAAPNPTDLASPAMQQLFKSIQADPTCAAVVDAYPPEGAATTELKFNGYFANANGQTFAIYLWAPGEAKTKRLFDVLAAQTSLINDCTQKTFRALLPDMALTTALQPIPTGLGVQGTSNYTKGTVKSAIAKLNNDSLNMAIANGPFFVEVVHQGPVGTLNEADFQQVVRVANQRLIDALR